MSFDCTAYEQKSLLFQASQDDIQVCRIFHHHPLLNVSIIQELPPRRELWTDKLAIEPEDKKLTLWARGPESAELWVHQAQV